MQGQQHERPLLLPGMSHGALVAGAGGKEYSESDELGERWLKRRSVIKGSKRGSEMEWRLFM